MVLQACIDFLKAILNKLLSLYNSGWRWKWLLNGLIGVGVLFLSYRQLQRRLAKYPLDTDQSPLLPEYDYIVVGAGSAGAAVAGRLAQELPNAKILLLEAGGNDDVNEINIPCAAMKLQHGPMDWGYKTTVQQHACQNMSDKTCHWPRGRVLGGCSSFNYMLFVRGAAQDYDNWATKMGCGPDWSYTALLPYFKKLEKIDNIQNSEYRGQNGPMECRPIIEPQETTKQFLKASASAGLTPLADYNAASLLGVSLSQYNVTTQGKRCNTATAYIVPNINRPNFTVLTHAHVTKIVFNDKKEAIGVMIKQGQDLKTLSSQPARLIKARHEVIVSAGAIGSPQLLQVSGIGPKSVLEPLKIPVIVDSPVGENLQDHMACAIVFESKLRTLSKEDENIATIAKYLLTGKTVLSSNFVEAMSWFRTRAVENSAANFHPQVPDIQLHFASGTVWWEDLKNFNARHETAVRFKQAISDKGGYTSAILTTLLHPASVGYVRIQSNDVLVPPIIEPNYLSARSDVDSMVEGCKFAMKLYEKPELKQTIVKFMGDEMLPECPYNRHTQENEYWEWYVRNQANTLYHPIGTCKMGSLHDSSAVVDPHLNVKGVSKLRVVDASVMPHLVSGNTNVPAIMIAERAVDFIKQAYVSRQQTVNQTGAPTNTKAKL